MELISFIYKKVVEWPDSNKRYNTPHLYTAIHWCRDTPIAYIQEIGVVRCPTVLKTSTFSCKDCENTFYVCYKPIKGIIARTNLETFSQKTNTYGAKLHQTLLKNNIETKLCYLQIGGYLGAISEGICIRYSLFFWCALTFLQKKVKIFWKFFTSVNVV